MNLITAICFALGFVLLVIGAELLVRGASQLAHTWGVSPLIIGLTVVAYGTSAPELAVTLQAVFSDPPEPDIAIGNVVGSNISNILLVLGISAATTPLVVSPQILRGSVPFMFAVTIVTYLFSLNGQLERWEGALLLMAAIGYSYYEISACMKETARVDSEASSPERHPTLAGTLWDLFLGGCGLAMLLVGARWLVHGAVALAQYFGISEMVIGLTVVAVGTSLPEIATTVVAGLRGQRDIAVGNVVGSNIFNLLLVLGVTSTVSPEILPVSPQAIRFDMIVMIGAAAACLPMFYSHGEIARWEGCLLLGHYVAYTIGLVLSATQHPALTTFSWVMYWIVIPLSAIALGVSALRSFRKV